MRRATSNILIASTIYSAFSESKKFEERRNANTQKMNRRLVVGGSAVLGDA
jgi:hypothetical protein